MWKDPVTSLLGGDRSLTATQTSPTHTELQERCVDMLYRWATHANEAWTWLTPGDVTDLTTRRIQAQSLERYTPAEPVAGYYGTGYASWGVMAQAATVGVFGVLAVATQESNYLQNCQKGLRFLFGTHAAGPLRLTDGSKWGSGVSSHDQLYAALWVEQGMLAYDMIEEQVTAYDRALIRSVLTMEADHYLVRQPGGGLGPGAGQADANACKAAVLARAALLYPENPHAAQWRQKSCLYWLNAISTESDSRDSRLFKGRPLSAWHVVSNFHTNFGVTHHGFFHPSDIALTLSVMAATALTHVSRGVAVPKETFHHWNEALATLSRLFLWDNTFACVGGQTWPRFTWDQSMLLPALAWESTQGGRRMGEMPGLGQEAARAMIAGILNNLSVEQARNGDGSFYSQRLVALREDTEWDYLRYEAGTAFALAAAYALLSLPVPQRRKAIEHSVVATLPPLHLMGGYREPSLGTIWLRDETRFASWSWQACRLPAQGLVLPKSGLRMAEWNGNLVGTVRLKEHEPYHALQYHREYDFTGGFATLGLLAEQLPMWPMADKTPSLRHGIGFFALPDGVTCILIDLVWCERQVNLVQNRGLLYRLANDSTNRNRRYFAYAGGHREISGVGAIPEVWRPNSSWLVVDNCLLIAPLWGGNIAVDVRGERPPARYGYGEATLLYDDICAPLDTTPVRLRAGATLRDTCTAYVCEVDGSQGATLTKALAPAPLAAYTSDMSASRARALLVHDHTGTAYVLAVNFDRDNAHVQLPPGWVPRLMAGEGQIEKERLVLAPASLMLCCHNG